MIQKKRTLRHFGIEEKGTYRGDLHELYIQDIIDAIDENQICALIGKFGSGKTTVERMALDDLDKAGDGKYQFVYVDSADLERLSAGQILDAIIMDLSNESARRSTLARSRQARRIMGERVRNGQKISLVIDNAHRLHPNVLMALKDEHEKNWMGYSPLFSVFYVGQEKLLGKLSTYKEVFWRTLILNLQEEHSNWMNFNERISYLAAVYGEAITPQARQRIARKARVPLEMEFYITEKMEEAKAAGKRQLDGEVVQLSLRDRREALGISQQDLASEAGIGKTTVHEVEHGVNTRKKPDVEQALQRLESRQDESGSQRKSA